jgi:hypothetical protein
MRANLLRGRGGVSHLVDEDTRHSLPIGQMGNYQDYLKKQPLPLRELESAPVRQHMFGNPFKTNKNLMMMTDEVSGLGGVDEVQIVNAPGGGPVVPGGGGGVLQPAGRGLKRPAEQLLAAPPKRRKGPLPRDFQLRSPRDSPAPSYRSDDLAYVPILLNEDAAAVSAPLVNGLKSAVMAAGGKMAAAAAPIEIDLDNEEAEPAMEEYLEPAALLREEQPAAAPGGGKAALGGPKAAPAINHKPAEAGSGLIQPPPARNHLNKNNNKTDFLRHDVPGKWSNLDTNAEAVVTVAEASSFVSYPEAPPPSPLHQAAAAGWQQQQLLPNGQAEHHVPTAAYGAAFQLLHQQLRPDNNLNAFSKDVIGEILNLPPAAEMAGSAPPPPPAPIGRAARESSPEVLQLLDHLSARRDKKLMKEGVPRWVNSPAAVPPPAPPPFVDKTVTEEELRSFRLRNNNVRQLIYKEVKRPGRSHDVLWKMLDGLHGPAWVRKQFIREVKLEALR